MGDADVFAKLSHLLEKTDIGKWENSGTTIIIISINTIIIIIANTNIIYS